MVYSLLEMAIAYKASELEGIRVLHLISFKKLADHLYNFLTRA